MQVIPPICFDCQYFKKGNPLSCDVYSSGIPKEILLSKVDHRKPYPGDHGIQYKERTSTATKAGTQLTMTGTDTRPDNKYNPDQLRMGIKVELEHTDDSAVAERIAKDHLDEIPDYYSRLRKMESGRKK